MRNVLVSLLMTSLLSASEYWSGCGDNQQEAKNNLAANILVKVESSFNSEMENSFSLGFENSTKETHSTERQSSTMLLSDLESYTNDSNDICVKVSKSYLEKFTRENIRYLYKNYNVDNLPNNVKDKAISIDAWLISLKFLKGLSDVFSQINSESVNAKIAELKNIRETLSTQYVKVLVYGAQITTDNVIKELSKRFLSTPSTLKIDNKAYDFSTENFLKAGRHSYTITGEHCKISNEFVLEKNSDKTISINLDEFAYPKIVFSSNKNNVALRVNAKSRELGKSLVFEKCSGEIHYEYIYKYGEPAKVSDEISLEAGLDETLAVDFLSFKEINELNSLVNTFKEARRLEIGYAYSAVDPNIENSEDLSNLHQFKLSYLAYKSWLRHGVRAQLGIAKESTYSVELSYMAALQMTSFGADKKSFRVSDFAILIPYLGAELGLGYNSIYNSNTKAYQDSFTQNSNVIDDYLVFKPLVGVDMVISEDIAIGIEFSKKLTMQKSYNLGFHFSLSLN